MPPSPDECAKEMLDVIPLIMRTIRVEMRHRRAADLTVPQFRTLAYISQRPGASLSEVAEFIGLTPPSASTLVDGLVTRSLVVRQTSSADRRRILLTLTASGQAILEAALSGTQARLAEILAALSPDECRTAIQALQALRPIFTPGEASK